MADGATLKRGYKAGKDDAMSAAIFHINQIRTEQGAETVLGYPQHWIGKDRPRSFQEEMRKR